MKGASPHLAALDGLRGVAVLMVMTYHFGQWFPVRTGPANALVALTSAGWAGVDMFFVLSGFLITRSLLTSRSDPRYFRNFYVRRALRIFPLYFLSLLGIFVLLPAVTGATSTEPAGRYQAWLWTFTANLLVALKGSWVLRTPSAQLNHFWSLAIEEQFYLFWPLVVALLPKPRLLRLAAFGLVASPLLRLLVQRNGVAPIALYNLTPCRLDGLLAGAMIASAIDEPASWRRLRSLAAPALVASAIGFALVVARNSAHAMSREMAVWGYFLATAAFAALLVKVLAEPETWLARGLRSRALVTTGKYSYGLYVLHLLGGVQWLVDIRPLELGRRLLGGFAASDGAVESAGLVAYVLACTLASYPLAIASYWIVERPFLKLKSAFSYAPSSAPVVRRRPGGRRRRGG